MTTKRKDRDSSPSELMPPRKKQKLDTALSLQTRNLSPKESFPFDWIPSSISTIHDQWESPVLDQIDWKQFDEQIVPLIQTNHHHEKKEVDCFQFKSPLLPSLFSFFKKQDPNVETPQVKQDPISEEDKIPHDLAWTYNAICRSYPS